MTFVVVCWKKAQTRTPRMRKGSLLFILRVRDAIRRLLNFCQTINGMTGRPQNLVSANSSWNGFFNGEMVVRIVFNTILLVLQTDYIRLNTIPNSDIFLANRTQRINQTLPIH